MSRPVGTTKPARWVAVTITHPNTDTPTEGVVSILPGHPPTKLYVTQGAVPSEAALAAVVALCGLGRAAYVAVQLADATVVEVTAIDPHRARDAVEASTTSVGLPHAVDVREVLDGQDAGQVTLVA